jgi:hypothetical protein
MTVDLLRRRDTRDVQAQGKGYEDAVGRCSICKLRREALGETSPAGTLALNLWHSEL